MINAFITLKGATNESTNEAILLWAISVWSDWDAKGEIKLSVIETILAFLVLANSKASIVFNAYLGKPIPITKSPSLS